jgi:MerR family transcriptional regulator, light-induced transcriptional regulator
LADLSVSQLEKKWIELQPENNTPAENEKIFRILEYANRFDWNGFAICMDRAERELGHASFLLEFVAPFLAEISRRVEHGRFSISQEHIVSGLTRQKLSRLSSHNRKNKSKKLVFSGPEGDFHDLGLWIGHSLASERGYETLFLGANMPKRDLSEACVRYEPTHLVITSTISRSEGAREEFLQVLSFLDRHLPGSISVWVAGRNAHGLSARLKRPFRVFNSLMDYWEELK